MPGPALFVPVCQYLEMEMIGGESFALGLLVCYDPFIFGHCFYFHVRRDFQVQISVSATDFHGVVLYIIQYDNTE